MAYPIMSSMLQSLSDMFLPNMLCRLSVSWTRVIPGGVRGAPLNPEGIQYYKTLLAGLRWAGIEPLVTLFHWDLPQVLQVRMPSTHTLTDISKCVLTIPNVLHEVASPLTALEFSCAGSLRRHYLCPCKVFTHVQHMTTCCS